MKKLLSTLVIALMSLQFVMAIPALHVRKTITLSDGSKVETTLVGDEYFHYYRADDGTPYRELRESASPVLSSFGEVFEAIPVDEFERLTQLSHNTLKQANSRRSKALAQHRVGSVGGGMTGTKRGLVILVDFKDMEFQLPEPQTFFNRYFNEAGFSDYGFFGSVRDYFVEQSYGTFAIDFDVVGPFHLAKPMWYYGAPDGNRHDSRPQEMIYEAVTMADRHVNFSNYDWDGDGEVDQVYVIYAGYAESEGADKNTIWPHESQITATRLDGVYISTYACSSELQNTSGTTPSGIGTPCHEFSHCLGYPDMYNTSEGTPYDMYCWDVLSHGSYNGAIVNGVKLGGVLPASYTSYERMEAGWLTPVELTSETHVRDMRPINDDAREAYILYNDGNRDEFYLIENRQQQGFDRGLPGHGLLVTHVDYDEMVWGANNVNADKSHPHMTVVKADNNISPSTAAGDVYPGTTGKTALTSMTTPASTVFNKNTDGSYNLNKSIEFITEDESGLISFLACRADLAVPVLEAEVPSPNSLHLTWEAVSGAESYEIEMTEYAGKKSAEESVIFDETFAKCYSKSAGYTDISSNTSKYFDNGGFSGSKLYQSPEYLKFGTSTSKGTLYTPTIDTLSTGNLTLLITVKPYKEGTPVKMNLRLYGQKGDLEKVSYEIAEPQTIIYTPEVNIDGKLRLEITADGIMYMSHLTAYDGTFSEEDIFASSSATDEKADDSAQANLRVVHRAKTVTNTTTETELTFTDLDANGKYEYRIRALDGYRKSLWSDLQTMDLGQLNGIEGIVADRKSAGNMLYDLLGRHISKTDNVTIYIRNGKKISNTNK